jgi:hypothetical protein
MHHFHQQKRNYHTYDTPVANPMIGLAVVILLHICIEDLYMYVEYSSSTNIQDVQAFPAFPKPKNTTTIVSALQQRRQRQQNKVPMTAATS